MVKNPHQHPVVILGGIAGNEQPAVMAQRDVCGHKAVARVKSKWRRQLVEADPDQVFSLRPGIILSTGLEVLVEAQQDNPVAEGRVGIAGLRYPNPERHFIGPFWKNQFVILNPVSVFQSLDNELGFETCGGVFGVAQLRKNIPVSVSRESRDVFAHSTHVQRIPAATVYSFQRQNRLVVLNGQIGNDTTVTAAKTGQTGSHFCQCQAKGLDGLGKAVLDHLQWQITLGNTRLKCDHTARIETLFVKLIVDIVQLAFPRLIGRQ